MDWTQYLYLALLLIGTGVAVYHGSRFVVLVMWANLVATMSLVPDHALLMMLVDFLSAYILLLFVEDKPAMTIAFIFCIMALIDPLIGQFGDNWTYLILVIVDVLAYAQIFAMGSTGFGRGIRHARNRLLRLSAYYVSSQAQKLDTKADNPVALEKDEGT